MHTTKFIVTAVFVAVFLSVSQLHANKTSVTIECPDRIAPGTEITVRVNASHNANNFLHHTDFVQVRANGTEIAKWTFSAFNRPESGNFSREIKYRVTGPVEITAMGSCNIHGSAGTVSKRISVP